MEDALVIACTTLALSSVGPEETVGSSPSSVALAALKQVRDLEARITALEQENAELSAFVQIIFKAFQENSHLRTTPEGSTRDTLLAGVQEALTKGHLESRNSLRTLAGLPELQRRPKRPRPEGSAPSKPDGAAPAKPLPPQKPQPRRTRQ